MRSQKLCPIFSQERKWILEQLNDDKLEKEVLTLSVVALHILSALTKKDLTGIELAKFVQALNP